MCMRERLAKATLSLADEQFDGNTPCTCPQPHTLVLRSKLLTQVVDGLDRGPAKVAILFRVVHGDELVHRIVGNGHVRSPSAETGRSA